MRAYFDCGLIDVGVIVTRAEELNDIFKQEKDNGGCPILAVGIGKECVEEYGRFSKHYTEFNEIYKRKEV